MQSNQCIGCAYYEFAHTCKAFPKKIPQDIIDGTIDHSKPIPDQGNDIVFKPIGETNA